MPHTPFKPDPPPARRQPLPITVTPRMSVFEVRNATPARIVGITQEYCIYRLGESDDLAVARWRNVALDNACPAAPLLPADVTVNNRLNTQAAVLREMLALEPFGLTHGQTAVLTELVAELTERS